MGPMAYEYPTPDGFVRLVQVGSRWAIEFRGTRRGQWLSPDAAAAAASSHKTGLRGWDQARLAVSDDLLRWRPSGASL